MFGMFGKPEGGVSRPQYSPEVVSLAKQIVLNQGEGGRNMPNPTLDGLIEKFAQATDNEGMDIDELHNLAGRVNRENQEIDNEELRPAA